MRLKYFLRFALLVVGFALMTFGLLRWHDMAYTFHGLFFSDGLRPHPVHLLILGIAMIPPALWELFLLDSRQPEAHDG